MEAMTALNLGCGRTKELPPWAADFEMDDSSKPTGVHVLHLDDAESVHPDVLCKLGRDYIALQDDSVDIAFAMHVLEHIGRQGELAEWFLFWGDLYRVMKPGARLYFESPYHTSIWTWADPTHSRAISEYTFLYLAQQSYTVGGAIPDYRPPFDWVLEDWKLFPDTTNPDIRQREPVSMIRGVLRAQKPFAPYWEQPCPSPGKPGG
jgi:hypothetical protein